MALPYSTPEAELDQSHQGFSPKVEFGESGTSTWHGSLKSDPIKVLLSSASPAIVYFTRRDLLSEKVGSPAQLWKLAEPSRLLRKQQIDGSWPYPNASRPQLRSQEDYNQIETFRSLGILVEKYAFSRKHPAIEKAAEYLFSRQTIEGDFRGIVGNQYTPYYCAAMMELLIKSGYAEDSRIERGFRWLLSMRQNDGGWAFPMRTIGKKLDAETFQSETIQPDRSKPFSHLITGIVLRAFAAHPKYRSLDGARLAAGLLASRFFKRDPYLDRNTPNYWLRVSYPFWFTDIISSLDSFSWIGLSAKQPAISNALEWVVNHQAKDGTFQFKLLRTRDPDLRYWVTLATCRVLARFAGATRSESP